MSMCGKVNHKFKSRCTRGKAHAANGLQHRDNQGNTWPLEERRESYEHMRPRAEFRARIRKAMRVYLDRKMFQRTDDQQRHAILLAMVSEAMHDVVEHINEYRRLDGQLEAEITLDHRKLLKFKEK